MVRACLNCEGRGTRRNYLNRAGDYTVSHCHECKGTGIENPEYLQQRVEQDNAASKLAAAETARRREKLPRGLKWLANL